MQSGPQLVVPAYIIEPLMLMASTETTRYYLNGIGFRPLADTDPRQEPGYMVCGATTDGHRLLALRTPHSFCAAKCIVRFSKPAIALIKSAITNTKYPHGAINVWVVLDSLRPRDTVAHLIGGTHDDIWQGTGNTLGSIPVTVIDGTFPDYERVLPKEVPIGDQTTGQACQARYLGDFAKAAKMLTETRDCPLAVHFSGSSGDPFWVFAPEALCGFIGVQMPLRTAEADLMAYRFPIIDGVHEEPPPLDIGRIVCAIPAPKSMQAEEKVPEEA